MNRWVATLWRLGFDLIYPAACVVCQGGLASRGSICDSCRQKFVPTRLGDWVGSLPYHEGLDGAYSGWYFTPEIQRVIHSLKYQQRAKLGYQLGSMLGSELDIRPEEKMDILTVVPLHPVRLRERGYNQSFWIGKGLAATWSLPFKPRLIRRIRNTPSQTDLDRAERWLNVAGAFRVTAEVTGDRIGLVDDVLTTGATLSACARALKGRGAEAVWALTCGTPGVLT